MAPPAPAAPVGTTPKPPRRAGGSWVSDHRGLILGVVVVVLGLVYFLTRRSSSSASAGALDPAAAAVPADMLGGGPINGPASPDTATNSLLTELLNSEAQLAKGIGDILHTMQRSRSGPGPAPVPGGPSKGPRNTGPHIPTGPPPPHRHYRPRQHHSYTVRRGDTLSAIAARQRIGGGWRRLYRLNRRTIGRNPNVIQPGQVLHW